MIRSALAACAAILLVAADATPGAAQFACPSGYRYQAADQTCLSVRQPSCPAGTRLSSDLAHCVITPTPGPQPPMSSCPAGYEFRHISRLRAECLSVRQPSCPSGTHLNTRTGRCVQGATPQ